jgi:protein-disulfide isomerase
MTARKIFPDALPRSWMVMVGACVVAAAILAATVHELRSLVTAQAAATHEDLQALRGDLRDIRRLLEAGANETDDNAPPAPAVRVRIAGQPSLGNPQASLVMVEFTDFQCPYCARHHADAFARLKKAFVDTQQMRYVTVDFPLDFHRQAFKAAEAAHCAENRYWDMHGALFANFRTLEPEHLIKLAGDLGLNPAAFRACLDSGRFAEKVRQGLAKGRSVGVDGTPSFVIGRAEGSIVRGRLIVGAQPAEVFQEIIQSHLALRR